MEAHNTPPQPSEAEQDDPGRLLVDLLALIHRDNGAHTVRVGLRRSTLDAASKVSIQALLVQQLESMVAGLEGYRVLLGPKRFYDVLEVPENGAEG